MKDLLRRFQLALPLVGDWIDALHEEHLPRSIRACDLGLRRVAAFFPPPILEWARVGSVPKIPFPPVSQYGVPEFRRMATMPMAGITFRNLYFLRPSSYSAESTHFHELVHVVQWRTLGESDFLLTYALGIAQHGYAQSPLEAIAYDLQARFERGAVLRPVDELVAHHAARTRDAAAAVFAGHGIRWGHAV